MLPVIRDLRPKTLRFRYKVFWVRLGISVWSIVVQATDPYEWFIRTACLNNVRFIRMKEFTELETAVLKWMIDQVNIPNLKEQITAAVVTKREFTGVGSFTSLSVPSELPAIHSPSPINGPVIESEGIEYGGGAILFLDSTGHITELEMYANGNRFAESITSFKLKKWEESNHAQQSAFLRASEKK